MNAEKCLDYLITPSNPIEDKAEYLSEYIQWHETLSRRMGTSVKNGRNAAMNQLNNQIDQHESYTNDQLEDVLKKILKHNQKIKQEHNANTKKITKKIKSLKPKTPIVIKNGNKEEVVLLIEMKRTRFICEFSDGRRCSAPVQVFIKEHEGKAPKMLSEEESEQRDIVRALAGGEFEQIRLWIIGMGIEIIPVLLKELEAALERIENAPVGLSNGLYRSSLGLLKRVNPRDQALTKRIPPIIADIAQKNGIEEVIKMIERYPNTAVRERCNKIIGDKI